jgi:predicted membrane GTPase involved in stress response
VCRVDNDRILVGRVRSGSVTTGDQLHGLSREAKELEKSKVLKVLGRRGLERSPIERGECGDIIGIAGFGACSGTSTSTRNESPPHYYYSRRAHMSGGCSRGVQ